MEAGLGAFDADVNVEPVDGLPLHRNPAVREKQLVPLLLNDLLLLGFDVYMQPPEKTVAVLQRQGYNLSKLSHSTWEGRPVYVIGATAGDTTSKQFWIDEERLLFVRLVEPRRTPSGTRRDDIRFQKYVRHGGGWVAEEVMMYRDGRPSLREEYASVRIDVPLLDALFDPKQWSTVEHWYRK